MRDYPEPHLRVSIKAPLTRQESVSKDAGQDGGWCVNVSESHERSVSFTKRVEGIESVAEEIYDILDARDDRVAYQYNLGDLDAIDTDNWSIKKHDATVVVTINSGVTSVFLAARKRALASSEGNFTRSGYSVERVLTAWMNENGFGYPDEDAPLEIGDLSKLARYALFNFCVDQTPGGEIDRDALPPRDESMEYRRDYSDLYGDE